MAILEELKDTIRVDIDGIVIDYSVGYNITGKVLNSKALIFDLPINGQRIILGDNQEEKKSQIEAFRNIIPLILPLGIVNQKTFFNSELKNIYLRINAILDKENIQLKELHNFTEPDSLEYYIHSSHGESSKYPDDFRKIWDKTINLIQNRTGSVSTDNFGFLGFYYPQFGFKIIPLIIPFLKHANTKRIAYENLANYVTADSLKYLLNELELCKDKDAISGILKALSKHNLKDPKIQDKLISLYDSNMGLSEDALANLMKVLKNFPDNRTFETGLKIVKANNRYSSGAAARVLLEMGCSAKRIVDIVLPKLLAADPRESEAAFSILGNSEKYSEYLPGSKKLLEIYVQSLSINSNLNIAYSIPSLIRNNYSASSSTYIVNYLSQENPNVLEGIMILIRCLMDEIGINISPFSSKKAKQRYIALLKHEQQKVVENTLSILQKIARNEGDGKYIALFLNVIDFKKDTLKNLYAMRAINHTLPAVNFNEKIVDYYKTALENTNYNYRVEALRGLRHCNDRKLKKSLAYLKDDPSEDVRREALRINEPPERVQKIGIFKSILRYAYFQIKYNGKPPSQNELLMEYLKKEVGIGAKENKDKIDRFKLK